MRAEAPTAGIADEHQQNRHAALLEEGTAGWQTVGRIESFHQRHHRARSRERR